VYMKTAQNALSKKEREAIFDLFTKSRQLRFNEIEKQVGIRSNHLSYHLDKMLEDNILTKSGEVYKLTTEAEKMIPFFAHITGKESGPLSIITAAIINKGKICLLKRAKRPYQGYWGLIGGKLKLEESIKGTALREAKEETGLDCQFNKISAVLHERVKEKGTVKHAFVIFLCKLTANDSKLKPTDEGEIDWFDLKKLPENIIPSDRIMIEKLLDGDFCSKDVIIDDADGVLKDMEVVEGGRL
jgi:ADP-ribose pyrophosphatase YjhB (NUDIX family)